MGLSASPGGGIFSAGCCPVPIASASLYTSHNVSSRCQARKEVTGEGTHGSGLG